MSDKCAVIITGLILFGPLIGLTIVTVFFSPSKKELK